MASNLTAVLPADPLSANASTASLTLAAMLVFIMTPAVGVFYSGLARQKHSLTLIMLSFCSIAIPRRPMNLGFSILRCSQWTAKTLKITLGLCNHHVVHEFREVNGSTARDYF